LFCRRFLSEDEVAIDVGASVGVMLDLLSAGSLRVIAVEPNPRLAQMIRKMRIDNVIVIEAAASDRDGAATLRVPVQGKTRQNLRGTLAPHNRFAAVPHDLVAEFYVRCIKLDELYERLDRLVSFINIDVEGDEYAVLTGAPKLMENHRPVVQVQLDLVTGTDVHKVFDLMANRGYAPFHVNRRELRPLTAELLIRSQAGDGRRLIDSAIFLPE
jgi:FkbM family methyltransferase